MPYSKVRAMTRIATPKTERGLLNVALHGAASHLETWLSRGLRRACASRRVWPSAACGGGGTRTARCWSVCGCLRRRARSWWRPSRRCSPTRTGHLLAGRFRGIVGGCRGGRGGSAGPPAVGVVDQRGSENRACRSPPGGATPCSPWSRVTNSAHPPTVVVHVRTDAVEASNGRPAVSIEGGPAMWLAERVGSGIEVLQHDVAREERPQAADST